MPPSAPDYYGILGVPRDAKLTDIGRAYNNLKAAQKRDDTPPDPRREALIEEAFRELADPERREAHDRSLVTRKAAPSGKWLGVAAGVAIAGAAAAYFLVGGPSSAPQAPGRPMAEILAEASRAVGRVDAFEMSGRSTALGLAVVVEPGVLVTHCAGIAPGAQIAVNLAPRSVPARVALADEALGLCKLAVEGAGSWPLAVSGAEPRAGDRAYAASLSAAGEVLLAEGTVKRVVAESGTRFIETSMPVAAGAAGGPLLDAHGRIVGIAAGSNAAGEGRHRVLPADWLARAQAPAASSAAPAPGSPTQPLSRP